MRRKIFLMFFGLSIFPLMISAQPQSDANNHLTEQQILGRRVLRQRCAVCHTQTTPGAKLYGPGLYKDIVEGNEQTIREFIMNGSKGRMPGFKYGLEPSEIDAIIAFLKTVPKPTPVKSDNSEAAVD